MTKGRMKSALLPTAFALALAMLPAAAPADDVIYLDDSVLLGGGDGEAFREPCPEDWALTGVTVTMGENMNSISPVCSAPNPGDDDDTTQLGTYGYAKDRPGVASCYPNPVLGMEVSTSAANVVHHLQLTCGSPDGETHLAIITTADGAGPLTPGGTAQRTERTDCPPGAFAVGLYGRYGQLVDAVGLMCGTVAAAQPQNGD